ncbi:transcription factor bHLH144-like [Primulina eburnea]|uniref:transcription factor bHLH144-like n=1 Tax=Primulina eburnea TaxID=1245227 RepID=UPI003C6C152C
MPGDHPNLPANPILPLPVQSSYYMQRGHTASAIFNGKFIPLHNVDIQTSDACPKKFVIFDRTHDRSQIMFHPNLSSKLFHPGHDVAASIFQDNLDAKYSNNERDNMSPLKEDSDDIDALLSTEYDDNYDDDMVSTARTEAIYRCDSPDSCSNFKSISMKSRPHFLKSSGSHCHGKKRNRTRKMVNALKGIVPGADHMSTVAVLDEAVRYLKVLRVEVQKLGTGSSEG